MLILPKTRLGDFSVGEVRQRPNSARDPAQRGVVSGVDERDVLEPSRREQCSSEHNPASIVEVECEQPAGKAVAQRVSLRDRVRDRDCVALRGEGLCEVPGGLPRRRDEKQWLPFHGLVAGA